MIEEKCVWYKDGNCLKGLPGTPCDIIGCVAYSNDLGHGPWEKGYQPSGIQDPIRAAASDLVDAVERYMRQECLRSELMMKKEKLKELLK